MKEDRNFSGQFVTLLFPALAISSVFMLGVSVLRTLVRVPCLNVTSSKDIK